MTNVELNEIYSILRDELPSALAKALLEYQQPQEQWVNITKAAKNLDCSPKLLKSMIDKGTLIPRIHYIDLTPDESRRTYRFNLRALTLKDLRSNLPERKRNRNR